MTVMTNPAERIVRTGIGVGAVVAGLVGVTSASRAALLRQAQRASDAIAAAAAAAAGESDPVAADPSSVWQIAVPDGDGVYLPDGTGPLPEGAAGTMTVSLLGDSTAVGYGCATREELPGARLARGLARAVDRPVRVAGHGVVGAGAADLQQQVLPALGDAPDIAVIMVGANDVRDRVPPRQSAAQLGRVVATLRSFDIDVVVGTCPDLGVITPIPQPLRRLAGVWSRTLARHQYRQVAARGGVPVPLATLLGPVFRQHPELFYADGFHPSGEGYARAVGALLPAVIDLAAARTP